jgi:MoaA/NifB/PqqE/SkfB family radical SAM enzyme
MFNFNLLKEIEIELTDKCQASCPMCLRNYHGGEENPSIKNTEWSLSDFKQIFSREVLDQISKVHICGSLGEPLMAKDFAQMMLHLKENGNVSLTVSTNASLRTTSWWKELPKYLPPNHCISFAIDGFEDTHSIHCRGTDWKKIIENAKAFISAGGIAEAKFIKFKHNEHQRDSLKTFLIDEIGFKTFYEVISDRFIESKFPVLDKKRNHLYNIEPPSDDDIFSDDVYLHYSEYVVKNSEETKCKTISSKKVYIDAYKDLYPCCWTAAILYNNTPQLNTPNFNKSKEKILEEFLDLNKKIQSLVSTNVLENPIKNIIDNKEYQNFWTESWKFKKMTVCSLLCGSANDHVDHYLKDIGRLFDKGMSAAQVHQSREHVIEFVGKKKLP